MDKMEIVKQLKSGVSKNEIANSLIKELIKEKEDLLANLEVKIEPYDGVTSLDDIADHFATFVLNHKRYSFPCNIEIDFDQFDSWDEVEGYLVKTYKPLAISRVFMMDHGNTYISLSDYNDSWDSGVIGFIMVTRENLKKAGLPITKKKAEELLKIDFESLRIWVEGDIYLVSVGGENEVVYTAKDAESTGESLLKEAKENIQQEIAELKAMLT
jgi:hypothetical protein